MRDIFDEAIGASPPTGIDIDTVIRRRRRVAGLRMAGGAGATMAAVVAAAVGVSFASGGTAHQSPGAGGHRDGTVSPSPSGAGLPTRPPETSQQTEQRLASTLTARLTALLPGVHLADRRTKAPGVRVYPVDAPPP